jgi:hypothetical protein
MPRISVVFAAFLACATLPSVIRAQMGVLAPATTLAPGRMDMTAAALAYVGRPHVHGAPRTVEGIDDPGALLLRIGRGLTDAVELQGRVALAEDIVEGGVGVKARLASVGPLSVAVSAGAHAELFHTDFVPDWFRFFGADAALIASAKVRSAPTFYGALDMAFESANVDLQRDGTRMHLGGVTRASVVPGLDYALRDHLHIVAEVGAALNDRSFGYVAVGARYSWR